MTHDFEFENLSNSGSYYGSTYVPSQSGDMADWPIKYVISNTNGSSTNQISVNISTLSTTASSLNSQYSGLYGFLENSAPLTAVRRLRPVGAPSYRASRH